MPIRQWTAEEFARNNPVFRAPTMKLWLVWAASLPPTIAASHWQLAFWLRQPLDTHLYAEAAVFWLSVAVGAIVSGWLAIRVLGWLKARHYERMRHGNDALRHCGSLLVEALRDEELIEEWLTPSNGPNGRSSEYADSGIQVHQCEDDVLFRLLDAWVKKHFSKAATRPNSPAAY